MATGADPKKTEDNLDDLLKCTICLETFKEPKCLPCLHTFCKLCIHTYVDSLKDHKKGEVPCPICRKPVLFTDSSDETNSIVDNLPSNNFVASLIEKQTITERQCNQCDVQGKQCQAVSWCGVCEESYCEGCVKFHKSNKSLAKHKIVSIEDLQNKTINLNETSVLLCDDHQERELEVYCVDHKKACCTLCATLSHRKCEKVISIEEAAAGIKQNGEVTGLLSKLETFEKLIEDVISCRNENEETFDTEATNIETAVTKMVNEMKAHLDKIQNTILSELGAAKKQMSMKVTDDINDFMSYKSAVSNWKSLLAGVVHHGSEQQCLVTANKIEIKFGKVQDEVTNAMTKIRNDSVQFKVYAIAEDFHEKISSIGELIVNKLKLKYERGKLGLFKTDFRNGEIKVIRSLSVASSKETSGIFLENQMIFSAYKEKKVMKYDQSGEFLELLLVPSHPTGLCHISDSRVVISSNSPRALYIVDCQHMTLLNTITLIDIPVWGVTAYENNQLLIGCNKQITWVDRSSGAKIKSVKTS